MSTFPYPPSPPALQHYDAFQPDPPRTQVFTSSTPYLVSQRKIFGLDTQSQWAYLTVYRYYTSVHAETVPPGETANYSVTHGIDTSSSDTQTVGVSLGLEAGFSAGGLSDKINATISASSSTTTNVAMSDSTTQSFQFQAPSGVKTSFQVWQLCEQYEVTTQQENSVRGGADQKLPKVSGGTTTNRLDVYVTHSYPDHQGTTVAL